MAHRLTPEQVQAILNAGRAPSTISSGRLKTSTWSASARHTNSIPTVRLVVVRYNHDFPRSGATQGLNQILIRRIQVLIFVNLGQ